MNESAYITLIKKAFPDLDIRDVELAQKGWDSAVLFINGTYIFRFPRRESSLESLKREIKVLPKLKQVVSLPIPDFQFISPNLSDYRKAFVGYPKINGTEFSTKLFKKLYDMDHVEKIAKQLGAFLTQLHNYPLKEIENIGLPERDTLKYWDSLLEDIKRICFPEMTPEQQKWTLNLFKSYLSELKTLNFRKALIHTEIGEEHILLNQNTNTVSGIIDFGDMAIGDYATDFYIIKRNYGERFLHQVLNSYELETDKQFGKRLDFYKCVVPFYLLLGGINLKKEDGIKRGFELLTEAMRA